MTTEELDQELLDHLAEDSVNHSYNAAARYRFLSRAYRTVMKRTRCTAVYGQTFAIAVDDNSFNLNTKLSLTGGLGCYDVIRVFYLVDSYTQIRLNPANYSSILSYRSELTGSGTYPRCFCFRRSGDTAIPYLEIYPDAVNAGSGILYMDWVKKGIDLSASQNPITPDYADDAIVSLAAAYIMKSMSDERWQAEMAEAQRLLHECRIQSFKEDRAKATTQINL